MCGGYRTDTHVSGVDASMRVSHQAGQRLDAAGLGGTSLHQHQRGSGVVDAGGVTGSHRTVFFDEDRFQFGHVGQRAVRAEMFVGVVGDITFAAFQHDRHDLRFEVATFNGALGPVVAFNGQGILLVARDAPFGGDVFGGHAHVDVLERVVQGADHHVDHFGIAHARTKARGQADVGRAAHVFGTTANGDVGVAQQDALAGGNKGLQARAAQAVDVEGGRAFGATAVDSGDARQIHVLGLGVDDMAEDHVADLFALDTCARQ